MIDYRSLQRKDNVTYESNIHCIYVFCLLQQIDNVAYEQTLLVYMYFFPVGCNEERMQPMGWIPIVPKDLFTTTKI